MIVSKEFLGEGDAANLLDLAALLFSWGHG